MSDSGVKVTPILTDCTSQTKPAEPNTFKVDVVLGTLNCQIDIEAEIQLDQKALDIKDIDKEVCVTQCEFIEITNPSNDCLLTGKLFLKGYVRKNIRYSAIDSISNDGVCGEIRHCTVNVPFTCAIPVENIYPTFESNDRIIQSFHGRKLTQFDQSLWQPQNTPVEAEINSVTINERDFYNNRTPLYKGPKDEATFTTLREKMVVSLNITLFQKRIVPLIPSINGPIR
ncbi:CsxC family protein [Chengkuizengella axinellae]|uniref:DUF7852 domain-containing protein n=1 Tax=Chengkuizengella axinellae TaxID=3064388 RepID=A0ABT9J1Y5_9BACL|nr:hypothetical protein [Chengkuizengella sp. 2205SS18-9]MDP5275583.1 hypothetical protein [Chengkuizengella sp. 2205SS18-9]